MAIDPFGFRLMGVNDQELVPWEVKKLYDCSNKTHTKSSAMYKSIEILAQEKYSKKESVICV